MVNAAATEIVDLWGEYEQLADTEEMAVPSEAVHQINDTMT